MSSSQKKTGTVKRPRPVAQQQRRMSSITRKLHWYWIRRRTLRCFLTDLFLFVLGCVLWCADREFAATGTLVLENARSLTVPEGTSLLIYQVVYVVS